MSNINQSIKDVFIFIDGMVHDNNVSSPYAFKICFFNRDSTERTSFSNPPPKKTNKKVLAVCLCMFCRFLRICSLMNFV